MIHTDSKDPAFRYEGLARAAFNDCHKFGDPFGIAAQDIYNRFVPNPTIEGKRALSIVLVKMIIDNSETAYKETLKKLEKSIWNSETQKEIINIIDEAIEVLNRIKNQQ